MYSLNLQVPESLYTHIGHTGTQVPGLLDVSVIPLRVITWGGGLLVHDASYVFV